MKPVYRLLLAVSVTIAMINLSGCANMSGGGWMDSAQVEMAQGVATPIVQIDGEDTPKATFGFDLTCEVTGTYTGVYAGHVTYHDHGSTFVGVNGKVRKLAFQIEIPPTAVDGVLLNPCTDFDYWDNTSFGSNGGYTPIPPKSGPGGDFYLTIIDSGDIGPDKDDFLFIELVGGILDGYENCCTPGGGNIVLQD